MLRSVFTVSGLTLVSRILAFVRDKLIANYLGSGALADVWVAAFRLPNLFRRVFGEGAFNAAFVPMYSRRIEEQGPEEADLFARRTLSLMATVLLVISVLCFIFMEPLVRITNVGFADDGRLAPAVTATRITIGYMIFICLVAALGGVLNSRKIFAAPALAYVALNVVFLIALFFVVPRTGEPLLVLSWSVIASGIIQLGIVFVAAIRRGVNLKPRLPVIDDDMKRLGLLMAPGLISAGIQQLNLLVGQTIASLQVGGNAAIYYADRINQLPFGLIGMAASVVLLPEITRTLRAGNEQLAKASLCKGIEMSMFLCFPAAIAMLLIPREIMHSIFEGGAFSAAAAEEAGRVLAAFGLGTPAYVLAKVLQPGFFSREDTKTPMRYSLISAVTNIILVYPLFRLMGATGCALATSIAGWVNVYLLWFGLQKAGYMGLIPGFFTRMARMLIAAGLMGLTVWALARWAAPWLLSEGKFTIRLGTLGALCSVGMAVYFALILLFRIYSLSDLKARFRRR